MGPLALHCLDNLRIENYKDAQPLNGQILGVRSSENVDSHLGV